MSRSLVEIDAARAANRSAAATRSSVLPVAPPEAMVQAVAAWQRWACEDPDREVAYIRLFPDGSGAVYDEDDREVLGFDDLDAAALQLRQLDPVVLRRDTRDTDELVALVTDETRLEIEVDGLKRSRPKCSVDPSAPCYETERNPCAACRASAAISQDIRRLSARLGVVRRKRRAWVQR